MFLPNESSKLDCLSWTECWGIATANTYTFASDAFKFQSRDLTKLRAGREKYFFCEFFESPLKILVCRQLIIVWSVLR